PKETPMTRLARNRTARPRRYAYRPRLDALEERRLLSTFQVTNTNDSGPGSLRQAILDAHADTGPTANIVFAMPAGDAGHFYYRHDGVPGQVSLTSVGVTAAPTDGSIADIDPDYAHSWWSIRPTSALPALTHPTVIDGYSQAGSSRNTRAVGDDAVLKL